ncbi:malonate decarboxylase subunit alpha [Neolewinella persica]|uniref:malonate decarboxylase subunit alpha n=1 Tax=Neolewinella persica TaxID=70998 RepID=UPI00036B4390|nr:malonate decarboxylase subunit alpha [Neolewinella persica]
MNFFDKLRLVLHVIRWRLTWRRHSLDYLPAKTSSDKFISARNAAKLIEDNSCVFSSGIAGNARCSVFFYAIRERFKRSGHPKSLTWINGGAQGGRGRVPGTIEELGLPGLMKSYLAAHIETAKAQLQLAQKGDLELYTLPQGVISLLLEEQGKGKTSMTSEVGLGTFLDPAVGGRAAINATAGAKYISREGDTLKYTMPQPEVALFSASYADEEGNIYFKHAATITESVQSISSVRKNKGIVMAAVAKIIPKNKKEISIPAEQVDYIVVNPYNEQTASILQNRYWPMFTPHEQVDRKKAVKQLKFINNLLKITPVRNTVDSDMARLAASLFLKIVPRDGLVNIGVGFPEEVGRVLVENDLEDEFIFTTEAGAFGGLPAPGIFFGATVGPDHLEPSSKMFARYHDHLDMAVLGFLEVDTKGNVNVSKKGPEVTDYVGPGGFPDIVYGAKNIIFIGHWMHKAEFGHEEGKVKLLRKGIPKFVEQVSEISFNGQEALRQGKTVLYVTNVGYFKLTKHGLQLIARFPGIDIEKDILANCEACIYIPQDESVPIIDSALEFSFNRSKNTTGIHSG